MSKRSEIREKFYNALNQLGTPTVTKPQIMEICEKLGISNPFWFTNDSSNRVKRGVYRIPVSNASPAMVAQVMPMMKPVERSHNRISNVTTDLEEIDLVPKIYKNFVPFGNFDDVFSIITSKRFFPVFISGHSGNGKTMSIEQACAKAKRKFVCVSMTPDTDESDLFGNYVLINGQMEWRDGPVTTAARVGAVLCIDEVDYGAANLTALQRVLEGKPFLLKKKGELIIPSEGFTVFATANTKGRGSEDGRYMFTNILSEPFLERFYNTLEQDWPPSTVEKKIIRKELSSVSREDEDFADKLVSWADVIRKTFAEQACDEVISTRRLVQIVHTYGIFGDKLKAITLCLNRFDPDTKVSFIDLYTKVDSGVDPNTLVAGNEPPTTTEEEKTGENVEDI